jgi:hypothetical protein
MRDEVLRYRAREKADWDSGARQVIGATIFVHDSIHAARGPDETLIPLAALCWVFRRQLTTWLRVPPVPVSRTNELVIHYRHERETAVWNRCSFFGTKDEIESSIRALVTRAPWALYGYTDEMRAAMGSARRLKTTIEIQSRRERARIKPAKPPIDGPRVDTAFEAERSNDWYDSGRD